MGSGAVLGASYNKNKCIWKNLQFFEKLNAYRLIHSVCLQICSEGQGCVSVCACVRACVHEGSWSTDRRSGLLAGSVCTGQSSSALLHHSSLPTAPLSVRVSVNPRPPFALRSSPPFKDSQQTRCSTCVNWTAIFSETLKNSTNPQLAFVNATYSSKLSVMLAFCGWYLDSFFIILLFCLLTKHCLDSTSFCFVYKYLKTCCWAIIPIVDPKVHSLNFHLNRISCIIIFFLNQFQCAVPFRQDHWWSLGLGGWGWWWWGFIPRRPCWI